MAIPERFLPRVMRDLGAAGLVEARTGRTGGYRLARPAAAITLLDVITAAEPEPRRAALRPARRSRAGSMVAARSTTRSARRADALLDRLARDDARRGALPRA